MAFSLADLLQAAGGIQPSSLASPQTASQLNLLQQAQQGWQSPYAGATPQGSTPILGSQNPMSQGSSAPVGTPPPPVSPSDDGTDGTSPDVVVQASRRKPMNSKGNNFPSAPDPATLTNGPDAPDIGNRSYAQAAQAALANDAPIHKGMFGVHGTLRDVLGTLGDAFLLGSGKQPIYMKQRQLERQQDAMSGFTNDPEAAAERMAQANPEMAGTINNQYQSNTLRQMELGKSIQQMQNENYQKYGQIFSNYMGAIKDQATLDKMRPLLQAMKQRGGLGDEYQVPAQFDQQMADTYKYGGVPAVQQIRTDLQGQRVDEQARHNQATEGIGQQNASANTLRAQKYTPSQPHAPQPTEATEMTRIRNQVNQQGGPQNLAPGDRATWNRYVNGTKGVKRTPPPLPPGFSIK